MIKWILRWAIATGALWLTIQLVHLVDSSAGATKDPVTLAVAVVILAAVNAFIRPIIQLLALPLTCLTLGLFSLVINGTLFYAVGSLTHAWHVSFLGAVIASIAMGIINGAISHLLIDEKKEN